MATEKIQPESEVKKPAYKNNNVEVKAFINAVQIYRNEETGGGVARLFVAAPEYQGKDKPQRFTKHNVSVFCENAESLAPFVEIEKDLAARKEQKDVIGEKEGVKHVIEFTNGHLTSSQYTKEGEEKPRTSYGISVNDKNVNLGNKLSDRKATNHIEFTGNIGKVQDLKEGKRLFLISNLPAREEGKPELKTTAPVLFLEKDIYGRKVVEAIKSGKLDVGDKITVKGSLGEDAIFGRSAKVVFKKGEKAAEKAAEAAKAEVKVEEKPKRAPKKGKTM